jgi:Cilia- and flagella-associated protein 298
MSKLYAAVCIVELRFRSVITAPGSLAPNCFQTVLLMVMCLLLQVGDRVGKNEKTKVTCKLQRADAGPPGREPVSKHTYYYTFNLVCSVKTGTVQCERRTFLAVAETCSGLADAS